MTSKSPVGDIPVVTLIRTDTTLDHSQKAEKVWTLEQLRTHTQSLSFTHPLVLGCSHRHENRLTMQCCPAFASVSRRHCWAEAPIKTARMTLTIKLDGNWVCCFVGTLRPRKNSGSHIDASLSRQPLVKGERLVRYEVNAVMCGHRLNANPQNIHYETRAVTAQMAYKSYTEPSQTFGYLLNQPCWWQLTS